MVWKLAYRSQSRLLVLSMIRRFTPILLRKTVAFKSVANPTSSPHPAFRKFRIWLQIMRDRSNDSFGRSILPCIKYSQLHVCTPSRSFHSQPQNCGRSAFHVQDLPIKGSPSRNFLTICQGCCGFHILSLTFTLSRCLSSHGSLSGFSQAHLLLQQILCLAYFACGYTYGVGV